MKTNYIWGFFMSLILLAACTHGGSEVKNDQFAFLKDLGITVTDKLLLGDTLTMPDIYCGDPHQSAKDLKGHHLSNDQYTALILPAGKNFADAMSNWLLLGVRDMGSGVTLAAFYAGNGMGYCVDLVTYDKQGHLLDAINARELHLLWRLDFTDTSNDTVFTLDGTFAFAGDRVTLFRTMGRCIMDFEGALKGAPMWQQTWQQDYIINAKGHFVLQGQQVVKENGPIDEYAALDFKSWDMLVCSMHDPSIMDSWNDYSELVNTTYDPDYKYNPFPWHVTELYRMNPQRFLNWMAAPGNRNNRLLPYFKLNPEDRPALLKEIGRIEDANARQWLTSLVNSWDNNPLTKRS
jgi:hypothetical protein